LVSRGTARTLLSAPDQRAPEPSGSSPSTPTANLPHDVGDRVLEPYGIGAA
jgi:hypothetical protein